MGAKLPIILWASVYLFFLIFLIFAQLALCYYIVLELKAKSGHVLPGFVDMFCVQIPGLPGNAVRRIMAVPWPKTSH